MLDRGPIVVAASAIPLHLALALGTDLSPDEAYYLCAARQPGLTSIVDHPPLLPWLLRLGDAARSLPVELRVRLVPIALSFATAVACAALVRSRGGDRAACLFASAVATFALLPTAGGFVATPDGPALLAITIALVACAPARPRPLVVAGALFVAALAKVIALPVALAVAFGSRDRRVRIAALAGPCLAAPWLVPSLRFQLQHAFGPTTTTWALSAAVGALFAAFTAQLLLWSPWVVVRGARSLGSLPATDRIAALGLTALIVVSALARALPPEPNWWAPAAVVVVLASSLRVSELTRRARVGVVASFAVPTLIAASHVLHPWLPLRTSADPTARLHGWRAGDGPVDAPGVGVYGPASERCVYQSDCDEIRSYFKSMNDRL